VRLGIVTPVVNLNPRFSPPEWEREGGIDDVVAVVRAAEDSGYDWVSCPEHVAIPDAVATQRGARYYDPLATLSYLAACTQRVGLLTHVLVLGYHHPLEVVKRYGTLDVISGGRVILGVGVGSLQAEFELLGREFAGRGERADDALAAIRAAFGDTAPRYAGPHYRFGAVVVEPAGARRDVAVWVGGRTRRSLRRALELGDGWIPFGVGADELAAMLGPPEVTAALAARGPGFDLVLAPEPPLDPVGDPEAAANTARAYGALGATGLSLRFIHRSRAHYVEPLQAMRAVIDEIGGGDG
jgi:probable F420-dependent oxidoreductase